MIPAKRSRENSRIKCLLVDDVQENLTALEALLARSDVEFLAARSGPAALELLLQHADVALAILDVQMPEMNGFELAELIRGSERTRHIPLIFMTAGSREQNWQFRGYETGAVDFLYKPIDPAMLVTKANVFFELHERKQALGWQLEELTEALRMNEMFMAVLSHDLRTPLQSITVAAQLLRRDPDAGKVSRIAGTIHQCGARMATMIDDLLDVTRIRQAGGLSLVPAPCTLDHIASRILDEVRTGFPDCEVESDFLGDLSGCWDADRLAQVMTNLLGNAIHHGDRSRPVRMEVDGAAANEVVFTVSNGGAIPAEILPNLFDPFRSRARGPGEHQGLGLGLFISQQIVLAHGGLIVANATDGVTRFRVTLPRKPADAGRPAE
ncbi:hybrid sensor histidine kinase/response regulator [Bordetella petrii]|uniref:hybrid sensor histidine kinase/response regulator n=1 Tax=Bordetella petrii TaxID=94624 RepID=UPI001E52A894|nr:hybrid sensor histidine kinase/response regulator [Bordetella petrii]MCD0501753.1 hybrid sensor histidine kinase/response regulator [Bordetella petrii]